MSIKSSQNLPTELQIKQNSCANCLHVRKGLFHYDETTWMCRAPQNLLQTFSVVTGERAANNRLCISVRAEQLSFFSSTPKGVCPWQVPERIYYPNGNSKSRWQIGKEAELSQSPKTLAKTTLDDI